MNRKKVKIGLPREIKENELRVALTPEGVAKLILHDHQVFVETNAGSGAGFVDEQYQRAGAIIVPSAAQVWDVDLVVKVKEPQLSEYQYFKQQIIFTFFHLSGSPISLTKALISGGTTAIAYEAIEDEYGRLPILEPMSAIAGNMSVLMGAYYLAGFNQGNGVQLGQVLSDSFGKVVVIGDGVVGQHAARVASALGSQVVIVGMNEKEWRLKQLSSSSLISFVQSNALNISDQLKNADLVVGAVLRRGQKSPHVVTEQMVKSMQKGSVIIDVSIDQGGAVETSRPTTHSNPTFLKHGVIHYCVANMPGAYPKTATMALSKVTINYIDSLAHNIVKKSFSNEEIKRAINVFRGKITEEKVANALGLLDLYCPVDDLLRKS